MAVSFNVCIAVMKDGLATWPRGIAKRASHVFETANLMHKVVRATYSNNSSGCAADTVLDMPKEA